MKKLIVILTATLSLSLLLAACGNSIGESSTTKDGTTTKDTTKSDGTDEPGSETQEPGEVSEVSVWNQIFEEWNQAFYTERAEEYNTLNRGFNVTQEFVAGDAWTERMQAAQGSNTAPDTYILSYNNIYSGVVSETLAPLNDLFTDAQLDDILDSVKEMVTFDDVVYAYPQLVEPSTVLFYRTDLFEDAGLTEPPKTWDELIDYAKQLTSNEVFGLGIPGFGDMGWATWGWQMQSAGHLAINDNWDAPTLDEGYANLAEFWRTLFQENAVPEQSLVPYADSRAYGEGSLAMNFSGSWGIAQLINDFPEIYEVTAVAPPPTEDGNTDSIVATNGGWSYVIDALSENKEGAANYLSWLLAEDPETVADFFEVAQYAKAAPRQSVVDFIDEQGTAAAHAAIVSEVAGRSVPEPQYPWDISVAVANMFEKVAIGGVDTETAIEEAEGIIQDIIDTQNLAGTNPRK